MRAQEIDELITRESKELAGVASIDREQALMLCLDAVALKELACSKGGIRI